MAASQRVVTVDLGTSTIKVAEFGVGKGGAMTLLRFGLAELGLDPNKEEERGKFITPTLAKLFKENRIKTKEVFLSISGQSVFMKFVKLPPVDPAQVEQVVQFEAQQNVPFPIDEVTWDYQMMPTRGTGNEAEAVIVAIKKDVLEAEVEAVERVGVKIRQVDVAPFALLNAFRYSELQTDDCALIIDMGARSTNLVFVEKSSFWIRNVPIAGNQISQAICNEMQEPFTAAETLKKGKGFVSLGGVYADPDDADAARISKLIRATMTRLHVDINRSIAYYRTTLNGAPPKRVFLTGGSSPLPYLDLFIADKLSLPVAYFNPLRNVNVDASVAAANLLQNNCCTAELVGLALRQTGSCPAEVTLDAPTLAARSSKRRKLPYYVGGLLAWALLMGCISLYYFQQTNVATEKAKSLQATAQELQREAPKIGTLVKERDTLQQTFDAVAKLGVQRDAWTRLLTALNEKIPDGVWITGLMPVATAPPAGRGATPAPSMGRFQGSQSGQLGDIPDGYVPAVSQVDMLVITGLYHANAKTQIIDPSRLRDFVNSLAALPYFDIDKNNITKTLISFTSSETDPNVFAQKFSMNLKLKTPVLLKP